MKIVIEYQKLSTNVFVQVNDNITLVCDHIRKSDTKIDLWYINHLVCTIQIDDETEIIEKGVAYKHD